MKSDASAVYETSIWLGENRELAKVLYGAPPENMSEIGSRVSELIHTYQKTGWHNEEKLSKLKKSLLKFNRDLGALTPRVQENIGNLENGAIESAHQAVVLGGPIYVLNKAAIAERIASINSTDELSLVPFFCVADYDIVQNELTHIRTPLMGSGGTLTSIPIPKGYEFSPVSVIPLPDFTWYEDAEEAIRAGYRAMFKVLEGNTRLLYEERLEASFSILRGSFLKSDTLGMWAQRIWAHLFNIEGKLGIPILPASLPEIREIWSFGMELLIEKKNREMFINAHNAATEMILDAGFETGIGRRGDDYVPFYLECEKADCHRSRTELAYEERGPAAVLSGKCPSCGEMKEIEISSDSPDLSEFAYLLSPRVDTRQLIIDTSLPVLAHAGGPGETTYYGQVIPIANELGFPFPLFIRYPRVYFNTPWNEALGRELLKKEIPVLHRPEMFSILGKVSRFRKKNRFEEMNAQLNELMRFIRNNYEDLGQKHKDLSEKIAQSNGRANEEELMLKLNVERYLSWAYGKFAEGKAAQESSWAWIDWAINSGFSDLFGPYQRAYIPEMKNGATLFVNFSI